MKKYWKLILWILLLLWIDWWSKYLFYNLKIWKELWLLEPVFNQWISWWISANIFIVICISFIGLWAFFWLWREKYFSSISFWFLIAWTIWNLLDRIIFGWVRDFISIWDFPVFNLADCYLTIAVCLIIIQEFLPKNLFSKKKTQKIHK
jgi:lipoprotein signal peptidase